MKGTALADGSGTRLYSITKGVSEQLLPILDEPTICYPISVLMLAGIHEILVISTPYDLSGLQHLLGDGSDFGAHFKYAEQPSPGSLVQAFITGEELTSGDSVYLVPGDNIPYNSFFTKMLKEAVVSAELQNKVTIFGYWVEDPERYGVAEFDRDGNVFNPEEKPDTPKSNYTVVRLHSHPNRVVEITKQIKPSPRGELEITSVDQQFLFSQDLRVQVLERGFVWFGTGIHDPLSGANTFIGIIERRQGLKIACLEGIAFRQGWAGPKKLRELVYPMLKNQYEKHLLKVTKEIEG